MNFDKKYKVYTWKNWMYLHWILNPGLLINELILGQRVPKITLEDQDSNLPKFERMYIPCPHCHTIHDSRTWSPQNGTGFKNWFGLFCPKCKNTIPCLMNFFSLLVLTITFPIWGWFKEYLKQSWLKKQPDRFKNSEIKPYKNPFQGKGWIKQGLMWGAFMFVFMTFIFPLINGSEITWLSVLIAIPIWIIGGLAFGFWTKKILGKRIQKRS
ncbi:hypothetical protein [Mesonia aquimarina]|uniref:hypothetical protein n=1 Tax=Mesonia aquimarina TaxID=1504967 RepID=UPI000EF5F0D0|nr:hypothetical protein [Mesonia aquimarina]